jgi:hypothetical protein
VRSLEPIGLWNPYYAAFARSLGVSPESLYGTIANVNFLSFMRREWEAFFLERGIAKRPEFVHPKVHTAFGAWLERKYPSDGRKIIVASASNPH